MQPNLFHIHSTTQGSGSPVILIHGMGASCFDWENLSPELASGGFQAHALDLPGHGHSLKPDNPAFYTSEAMYALLESWIDSQGFDQPLVVIGHSLGGYLSLRYALRHPERVRAQVLIDPFYSPQQLSPLVRLLQQRPLLGEKALRIVPEWVVHRLMGWDAATATNFSPAARQQIAADLKRCSPHIVYIPRTITNLTGELRRLDTPSLVIWGEKDLTLDPDSFPELVTNLPRSAGKAVPGCGHQPHIGKPALVNRLVLDFLGDPAGFVSRSQSSALRPPAPGRSARASAR